MYSLSLLDANGCKSIPAPIVVEKPNLMIPEIIYSGSLIFCDGSSLILSANVNPLYLWQWQNGSHTFDTLVTRSGTYITGIDQMSGCVVGSDTIEVAVGEIEDPVISVISGTTTLCQGDSVTLESTAAAAYYWLGPGTDVVDNISRQFVVYEGGTYDLAIENDFGCVAAAEPIEIFLDTLTNEPQIYGHGNFNLNVVKTYYTVTVPETQVEWTIKGGSIDFPNKDTISVVWTDVTVPIPVDEHIASSIHLYPNPADSYVKIETLDLHSVENIAIYNQAGVLQFTTNQLINSQLDVSDLSTGMYYISFNLDEMHYSKKIYKQ